jgi:hypothetical protein
LHFCRFRSGINNVAGSEFASIKTPDSESIVHRTVSKPKVVLFPRSLFPACWLALSITCCKSIDWRNCTRQRGIILADLLAGVRLDVRILTNQLLSDFPELAQMCIFIDPFDRPESRISNGRALRQAIRHLHSGGMMLVFPAGEVSHFDRTAARLIRITRAKSVPTLIRGANGIPFQMLAMVHSRLRTAASRIEATWKPRNISGCGPSYCYCVLVAQALCLPGRDSELLISWN